ncbi:MAG: T9SS type A sorting domain-containing protein [Saprospiraceae bacterium]|nr:T9SS type A sorting domain-containing protein [Saprospiraceae bacterium]
MKKHFLSSALMFAGAGLFAQITVTDATFPVAGDTLKVAIDNAPSGINAITPPGGNQTWDFSSLQVDATQNFVFRPASEGSQGANVPGADLFTVPSPNAENYYNVTATAFAWQAYYGIVPYDLVANHLFKYNPPLPERHAPLNFLDIRQSSTGLLESFSPSAFTPALIAALPVTPDSLRYRVAINRLDAVDGWGSVSIPGGTYNVLREKRTRYQETRLDGKVPPLGWLDITDVAIQAGFNGLGVDTTVAFYFHNDVEKEIIAIVTLDNAQSFATQVTFKANGTTAGVDPVADTPALLAQPNPAHDRTNLHFSLPAGGDVVIRITDMSGRLVAMQKANYAAGAYVLPVELPHPGMYVAELRMATGVKWVKVVAE